MEMTNKCQVECQEYTTTSGHRIGRATLNATASLNALTLDMIDGLYEHLCVWQDDDQVVAVVLDGAGGKAFCAGGDIRQLHTSVLKHDYGQNPYGESFFAREYQLDHLIHTYSKPVLCWGAGIVMGGGVGLMAGASHRVVTPSSKLAMPEVSIGLFPDVGGSWILGRMPGRVGLFLGLTGTRMTASDALFCGMADRFLDDGCLSEVIQAMQGGSWLPVNEGETEGQNGRILTRLLRDIEIQQNQSVPTSKLQENFDDIQGVTDADTPAEILALIKEQKGEWWQRAGTSLEKGCPMTAGLVMEQLERAKYLSLADIFRMELNMAVQCLRSSNFTEGVRALLLERGTDPAWAPATLDDVTQEMLQLYFMPIWGEAQHPLINL